MRFEVIWETTARLVRAVILGSERAHPGVRPRVASKDARKHLDRHPEVLARPLRPGEPRRMTDTVQVLRGICIALMTLVFASPALAEKGKLRERLTPEVMAVVYPAGVDLVGRITGAKVVFHNESYIVHDTIRQRLLDTFLAREAGRPMRGNAPDVLPPDYVTGATISARAMRGAVLASARLVLRARVKQSAVTVPTL